MKVCLVSWTDSAETDPVATYVARLQSALAAEHRTMVVMVGPGLAGAARAALILRRHVERDPPDLVHLHGVRGIALGAILWAAGERLPIAITLHNRALLARFAAAHRWLTNSVGLAISPSHHLLEQHLQRGFFGDAIQQILPYGIELVPPPPPRPFGDAYDVLDLSASLTPAARRMRLRAADCVVIRPTTAASDFLILEEAFQAGAVVILSRSPGASEMVRDGVNGLLVEPGDDAGIAAAIERLRGSPELAARLRASALETARLYDMRFHIARLTDAYRQLLTASRAGDLDRRAA